MLSANLRLWKDSQKNWKSIKKSLKNLSAIVQKIPYAVVNTQHDVCLFYHCQKKADNYKGFYLIQTNQLYHLIWLRQKFLFLGNKELDTPYFSESISILDTLDVFDNRNFFPRSKSPIQRCPLDLLLNLIHHTYRIY